MSKQSEQLGAREEAALVEAARQGEQDAMNKLLVAHQDRVYRTALGFLGGDEEGAFEVAQQVLISAFRNLENFRGDSRLGTWLYRMTINYCKNHQLTEGRRAARFVSMENNAGSENEGQPPPREHAAPGVSAREQAAGNEIMALLHARLSELPEEFRSVLILRYIEDASYEQIAEALDIAPGTVKSRVNRGRKELKKLMGDLLSKGGSRK